MGKEADAIATLFSRQCRVSLAFERDLSPFQSFVVDGVDLYNEAITTTQQAIAVGVAYEMLLREIKEIDAVCDRAVDGTFFDELEFSDTAEDKKNLRYFFLFESVQYSGVFVAHTDSVRKHYTVKRDKKTGKLELFVTVDGTRYRFCELCRGTLFEEVKKQLRHEYRRMYKFEYLLKNYNLSLG